MMTVRGRFFGALLLAALLSGGLSIPASAVEDQTSAGFETVLRGTNDYRELNGVDRLVYDPQLTAVAQAWAEQMAADYASSHNMNKAFRHNPNTGSQIPSPNEGWGENIAMNGGYAQPYDELLTEWRNSPPHNANMLDARWTHIGIGTYQDAQGLTWGVQIFGDYGSPAAIPDPIDAVIDLDSISYSGTVACVVLVNELSGAEFFRQCGPRTGNVYTFSDFPPGSYSVKLLAASNAVLFSGLLVMVTGVSPGYGPTAGGTSVTVTGSHFTGATSVTFGGVAGTNLSVHSDTQITVTTPTGANLQAPVVVTIPGGAPSASPKVFFAYTDPAVVAESPVRVLDASSFTAGHVRCYPSVGRAGVPQGAVGVVLNVTTVSPSGNGYVVVYPDTAGNGATVAPNSSTVNFEPGRDVANSAIVALPSDGEICAYSAGGTLTRLILDVAGYVVPGSGITIQSAQRLLDTRQAAQQVTGPVEPNVVNTVQVTGNAGVPAGATAVVANITVVGPTAEGHLRAWAAGTPVPNTSVVNYAPGQTKANGQIIALSPSGALSFESFTGAGTSTNPVQVIIDVVGYVAAASQFTPTAPTRIVETRATSGVVGPIPGALVPNTVYPVMLSDTALIPSTATAVVLNVTAVGPTEFGNLRVYPDTNSLGSTPPPLASTLNYIPGRAIPNMVIVQISTDHRTIDFYNNQGLSSSRTHLIVDVIGYIGAPTS
jgi:uncharacterized protein YkwD